LQSAAPAPPDLLQAALRTPLPPASACASAPQAGPAADERGAGGAGPSAGAQQRAGQGPPPAAEPRPPAPALPAGRGGKHVGGAAHAPSTGPHPGAQESAAEAARLHAQARAMKARLAALVAALGDPVQLAALPDGGRQVRAGRFHSERPDKSSFRAVKTLQVVCFSPHAPTHGRLPARVSGRTCDTYGCKNDMQPCDAPLWTLRS